MYWSTHNDNDYYIDGFARICYLFTTTMTVITIVVSIIFIYIVITQSKQLGTFKWFMLNHTIWGLCFEIALSVTKPALLSPVLAGFIVGPLGRICTYEISLIFFCMDIGFGILSVVGLLMSLASRYGSIFPGLLQKIFSPRNVIIIFGAIQLTMLGILSGFIISIFDIPKDTFINQALEYDIQFKEFINESSFLFIHPEKSRVAFSIFDSIILFFIVMLVIATVFLIHKFQALSKHSIRNQRYIMVCLLSQVFVTISFQLIPLLIFISIWTFQFKNTFALGMLMIDFLTLHTSIEMITILYFVTPYRQFLLQKFYNILNKTSKKQRTVINIPSHIHPNE